MIQGELAVAVGISQNYLSGIEDWPRKGPAELQEKVRLARWVCPWTFWSINVAATPADPAVAPA